MNNDEYFNSYMASLTNSRAIIRSAMNLLEQQDDMFRLMYLNWIDSYEEEEPAPTPTPTPVPSPTPLRRRTHSPIRRTVIRNSMQYPLNTRIYRDIIQRQVDSPPVRLRNLDNNNQPIDDSIANIFAQAILNSIGNINQVSPVVIRPSQRTIELATENMLFSEIPACIDRYQQCPISQDNFQPNTPITRIIRCGHYFERDSIATWFQTSSICPICRADIREEITNDRIYNEEVGAEENTNNSAGNGAEENTNNSAGNNDSNTQRDRDRFLNIVDRMISSTGEANNFPIDTISYQLEFAPVVENVLTPTSSANSQTSTSNTSWLRRARNNIVGDNRTTIPRSDSSGNNFSL